jgi:hypothetical protein
MLSPFYKMVWYLHATSAHSPIDFVYFWHYWWFELGAFALARQVGALPLEHTYSLLLLWFFWRWVLLFAQASLDHDPLFMLPSVARMTVMHHHAKLWVEMGVL